MNTIQKLDQLAELQAESDLLKIKKQELIDTVLTPEIKSQIAGIEVEFEPQAKAISDKDSELRKEIKAEIIEHGETVKGKVLQAVYSKGKRNWDLDKLEGYAVAHEEIKQFRKPSKPSVSIKRVK